MPVDHSGLMDAVGVKWHLLSPFNSGSPVAVARHTQLDFGLQEHVHGG